MREIFLLLLAGVSIGQVEAKGAGYLEARRGAGCRGFAQIAGRHEPALADAGKQRRRETGYCAQYRTSSMGSEKGKVLADLLHAIDALRLRGGGRGRQRGLQVGTEKGGRN